LQQLESPLGLRIRIIKDQAKELIQTVKLMSEVKVVRRHSRIKHGKGISAGLAVKDLIPLTTDVKNRCHRRLDRRPACDRNDFIETI